MILIFFDRPLKYFMCQLPRFKKAPRMDSTGHTRRLVIRGHTVIYDDNQMYFQSSSFFFQLDQSKTSRDELRGKAARILTRHSRLEFIYRCVCTHKHTVCVFYLYLFVPAVCGCKELRQVKNCDVLESVPFTWISPLNDTTNSTNTSQTCPDGCQNTTSTQITFENNVHGQEMLRNTTRVS